MANSKPFQGKVICITGAAQGIGRATAEYLDARGATLSLSDLSYEKGVVADIDDHGNMKMYADVCDPETIKAWIEATVKKFGRLDGCVNNAGVAPKKRLSITELGLDEWNRVINVNLTGVFNCLKYELQHMVDGGSIVNVTRLMNNKASTAGLKGIQNFSSYVSSKHGVIGLTKAAALEGAARKIRVNAVCPSPVQTAMHTHLEAEGLYERGLPPTMLISRVAEPQEIAASIAFFLGDESKFVTQVIHPVDGGLSG